MLLLLCELNNFSDELCVGVKTFAQIFTGGEG